MKNVLTFILLIIGLATFGQTPVDFYNNGANQFIDGNKALAINTLNSGIKKYPNNEELKALKKRIEEEDKEKQDQDKKDEQNKDQENKDEKSEEKKDEKGKEDKDSKEKQDQKDAEEKEKSENGEQKEEGKDGEKSEEQKKQEMQDATKQKLQEMNMSEEKAKMILEALKNNEVQYIQQRKREATQRPDSGKPDW
jgi:outer membrane biosynthesis protein TonB